MAGVDDADVNVGQSGSELPPSAAIMILLFRINGDLYGLDIADVVEVMPNVPLQAIPRAPNYVPGLLTYRGVVAPVVDLSMLVAGRSALGLLSSRIMLVRHPTADSGFVGLLAEDVTETVKFNADELTHPGVDVGDDALVDAVAVHGRSMVRKTAVDKLFSDELRQLLNPGLTALGQPKD